MLELVPVEEHLGAGQPSGTRAFLLKPYTPEQLCDEVARLVCDAREHSPRLEHSGPMYE
jgi:hypothetical protein